MAGVPKSKAGAGANIEYAWEKEYTRTWETVQEDEDGRITAGETNEQRLRRARGDESLPSVRRGMIRYLFVILDLSKAVRDNDLKPSRRLVLLEETTEFVRQYFDQNPLSQLGLIVTRNQSAQKITDLTANPAKHIEALQSNGMKPGGEMSLEVALTIAWRQLSLIPKYGHREVLFLYSGLSTSDPGDIFETIKEVKKQKVRVSFVSLSAELCIAKTIATETGGTFGVALHQPHFKQLLTAHTRPPPTRVAPGEDKSGPRVPLVKMGFPSRTESPGYCACHNKWITSGYKCPRCSSLSCEIPGKCPVCALPLVSAPTLARSYHHLFPVDRFVEVKAEPTGGDGSASGEDVVMHRDDPPPSACFGCLRPFTDASKLRLRCSKCDSVFCFGCDVFIHDSLHNCPGCCV